MPCRGAANNVVQRCGNDWNSRVVFLFIQVAEEVKCKGEIGRGESGSTWKSIEIAIGWGRAKERGVTNS